MYNSKKMKIDNYIELTDWLAENDYFDDGHIFEINENPLEIIVGSVIEGNYNANTTKKIQTYKIHPVEIITWTFDETQTAIGEENYIEYIDAISYEDKVCLEFITTKYFRLEAKSLIIEKGELIESTFKPWLSETEIFATVGLKEIPQPSFWKEKLGEYGHNVSFRYFSGEVKQIEDVPYPDYQGYYLQLNNRIQISSEGIFFMHLDFENENLSLNIENKDQELSEVWHDLNTIIADLPNARINSGNCEFSGDEWKQILHNRTLKNI